MFLINIQFLFEVPIVKLDTFRTTDYWLVTTDWWLLTGDYWLGTTDYWLLTGDYWLVTTDYWLVCVCERRRLVPFPKAETMNEKLQLAHWAPRDHALVSIRFTLINNIIYTFFNKL